MLASDQYKIPSGNHLTNTAMKHLTGLQPEATVTAFVVDENIAAVDYDGFAYIYLDGIAYLIDQIEFESPMVLLHLYGAMDHSNRYKFRRMLRSGSLAPKIPEGTKPS